MARDEPCPTCSRLTYSIKEYAMAMGVSERQARYQLRAGDLNGGALRVGDRVLISRQWTRDQIDRALGRDPDPELEQDERETAAERAKQMAATEREDVKRRKEYLEMRLARREELTPAEQALVR